MSIFDRYIFRNLLIATVFVSVTLLVVIFLSQSLRFLELVLDSSASSLSFWILTFLALPRFFEIIIPLGMMAGTLFIYNRMTMDSELVVVRSAGYSPMEVARPALMVAGLVTVFLWFVTMWVAPRTISQMDEMQQAIKSQFSAYLFRDGVFNQIGNGLTVYIRERSREGELHGVMIYDGREKEGAPSTILAKRGALVAGPQGFDVVVYDGSRQEFDSETGKLQRLNFERYTVELPDADPERENYRQPDERTFFELFFPDMENQRDVGNLREFRVEIHRRLTAPLLALAFTMISCAALLLGPLDRRGQAWKIAGCIGVAAFLQAAFLASFNLAQQTEWALVLMYLIVLVPLGVGYLLLSVRGEALQHRFPFIRRLLS